MKFIKIAGICLLGLTLTTGCSHRRQDRSYSLNDQLQLQSETSAQAYENESGELRGYSTTIARRQQSGINQSYYFDFDRYDVSEFDQEDVRVQAEYLVNNRNAKVRLEGNTDIRGSREYNVALGWKRANAIAKVLRAKGVRDEQIAVVSFGKEKPIANGTDEDAHSRNRRVDLIFEQK